MRLLTNRPAGQAFRRIDDVIDLLFRELVDWAREIAEANRF